MQFLTNKYQELIIDDLLDKISKKMSANKKFKQSDETMTFVPYYDSIVDRKERSHLCECKMTPYTHSKVREHALRVSMNKILPSKDLYVVEKTQIQQKMTNSSDLIEYMPERSHKSVILSDIQLSNFIRCLPSFYRQSEWKRIFNLDEDGCSLITFFQNCREYETTVMVIQDQNGWIFGGFCTEAWRCSYTFFGNG